MKQILFVCTGNTCRSPMAEGIFNELARRWRIGGIQAGSAGLAAFPGDDPAENAVRVMAEWGIDISAHRSRALTPALLEETDAVVCMTPAHRTALAPYFPAEGLYLLSHGVRDPYGGDMEAYRRCADQIFDGMQELVKWVRTR